MSTMSDTDESCESEALGELELGEELIDAVRGHDEFTVRELLALGADPNMAVVCEWSSSGNRSILNEAISVNDVRCVVALLEGGASVTEHVREALLRGDFWHRFVENDVSAAVAALSRLGEHTAPPHVSAIAARLSDEVSDVREAAVFALAHLGVLGRLGEHADEHVWYVSRKALHLPPFPRSPPLPTSGPLSSRTTNPPTPSPPTHHLQFRTYLSNRACSTGPINLESLRAYCLSCCCFSCCCYLELA